jgi:hypothetical protein
MRKVLASLVLICLTTFFATLAAQQAVRRPSAFAPQGTPIAVGLAGFAKVLCSAVFVSGRDPVEAFRDSGYSLFPDDQRAGVTYAIDREAKLVRMTHGAVTRIARFYGDQGCIIQLWHRAKLGANRAVVSAGRLVAGQRTLPEGWAKFVSTPAAAWKQPVYGGLFWVNGDGAWNIPKTAYFANGAGGQRTFIIPTHDMVVVRMGHYRGDRAGMRTLNAALQELMLAVEARP